MDSFDDFKRKYAIWAKEKQKEENLMRELDCDEDMILELREYDKNVLNQERRYYAWNYELFDYTLNNYSYIQKKDIMTFDDFIDIIDDPDVYSELKGVDHLEQQILTLKLQGYHFNEMAQMLDVNPNTLYSRYKKVIKIIRKSKK